MAEEQHKIRAHSVVHRTRGKRLPDPEQNYTEQTAFRCPDCAYRLRYTTATIGTDPIFQCGACAKLFTCTAATFAPLKLHARSASAGVIPEGT